MEKQSNFEGYVFNHLLVRLDLGLQPYGKNQKNLKTVLAECLNCSSGVKSYRLNSLKTEEAKSCGCLKIQSLIKRSTKHGKSKTATHRIWKNMRQRCCNPNNPAYQRYGGRGITICERWAESFENFLEDMGERPSGFELDRIDNNQGYYPENCRWVDLSAQAFNKRKPINNKSGKTGVCWRNDAQKWAVQIIKNNKKQHLGLFENLEDAIQTRKKAELEFFGYIKD